MLKPVDIKTTKVFETKEQAYSYVRSQKGDWEVKPFQRWDKLYFWKAVKMMK